MAEISSLRAIIKAVWNMLRLDGPGLAVIKFQSQPGPARCGDWTVGDTLVNCEKLFCFKTFSIVFQNRWLDGEVQFLLTWNIDIDSVGVDCFSQFIIFIIIGM